MTQKRSADDEQVQTPSSPPSLHPSSPFGPTLARHERELFGQERHLTIGDVAERSGLSVDEAGRYWRAMGFSQPRAESVRFTDADAEAIAQAAALSEEREDGLRPQAAVEMLRAGAFTMDRLVLWQFETLVNDLAQRYNLDDTSARLAALDRVNELFEPLREQADYLWRRHMLSLLARTDSEVSNRGKEEAGPDMYPLTRSLGFVDIVSFTQRAQTMSRTELATMLDDFETTTRDVVTARGARVVKTIGDAVMYIADELTIAADVVTALVEELQRGPEMIRVRASLVQGRVVSRSGDVFGPPVNLASRLVDTADPGGIRMDGATARSLLRSPVADQYLVRECKEVVAKGLGNIRPWSLQRIDEHTRKLPH